MPLELEALAKQISSCTQCELRATATGPVVGLGPEHAEYFIIGKAPSREEDAKGMPFIGLAGRKLNQLLQLANIDPNKCYITNICKCRPSDKRDPRKGEVRSCTQWLMQELETVQPKTIITLGSLPLALFTDKGISQLHGTSFNWNGLKVIAQYCPSATFKQPRLWATMLGDWQNIPDNIDASFKVVMPTNHYTAPVCALDTENAANGSLGIWSVAYRNTEGFIEVSPHYGKLANLKIDGTVVMHHAKHDIRVLKNAGIDVPPKIVDTMIGAYCLGLGKQDTTKKDWKSASNTETGMVGGLGLKYLTRRHLGMTQKSWMEVRDNEDDQWQYNAEDSVGTLLLWEKFAPKLPKHFWNIDMPLLEVCMSMEDRGIQLDTSRLGEMEKYLADETDKIKLPFKPTDTELRKYIYDELKITPFKFTEKEKKPSVDASVLELIDDPVIKSVLAYKAMVKEKDTYVANYVEKIDSRGRIHPEFKQTSTATGRLSCANPNLQNVPTHGPMRSLFIAKPGHKLVVLDASQLEYRVFAALSQDPQLLEMYAHADADIHAWAQRLFKLPPGHEHRRKAKVRNFAVLFGGSPFGLSRDSGMPIDEANAIFQIYHREVPGVKIYQEKQRQIAREHKSVTNYFGRTRRLDAMFCDDWRIRAEGERESINTPVQGTGGDIVKTWMIDLYYKHKAPILLQVHDELIMEIETSKAAAYAQWLREYIPTIVSINGIKFPADVGVGHNWAEAKENCH